jgi:hypothetical protein
MKTVFRIELPSGNVDEIEVATWEELFNELDWYANIGILKITKITYKEIEKETRVFDTNWRGVKGPKGWVK